MRPLIAGNWKMNGLTEPSVALARAIRHGLGDASVEVLLCPPATQLASVTGIVEGSGIGTGGQDCHAKEQGAHTGDISAVMLRDAGASYVILGHSERRQDHGETSEMVAAKVRAAVKAGLIPIVCVGETESERASGAQEAIVGQQIAASLPEDFDGVVAYEPIWAIGTGKVPTSADITRMHDFIRKELIRDLPEGANLRILYGGSVKPSNAAEILSLPEVGGALVGGASLIAEDFLAIIRAV
ncbi:triose-phosphate isomerase [Acidisoma cellulosilytica]|uniref:Triosephosphate isomerase n=1 Tax=Acidisoma cellulosilyticum TaxID=2802395 RepID=A0A963YYW7_9PROT|nr:triose-phosphate isomerase [Acidisoma cellulosilyticum]MCB8878708.1 triose-phosphate isomerase [Acidisoma cellulosilyticum]